jgi:hypothetical protein
MLTSTDWTSLERRRLSRIRSHCMEVRSGFHDECGIFGVADSDDAANLVLGALRAQHRGRTAGITLTARRVFRA